eukprot:gene13061-17504_t
MILPITSFVLLSNSRILNRIVDSTSNIFSDANADPTIENLNTVNELLANDVNSILNKITKVLQPISDSSVQSTTEESKQPVNIETVKSQFNQLLDKIKSDTAITDNDKRIIFTEANMIVSDARQNLDISLKDSANNLLSFNPKSSIYSPNSSPVLIVTGPGIITQKVLEILAVLGKAVQVKKVDGEQLSIIQESELKFLVRDIKSVIIIADSMESNVGKKSWFGSSSTDSSLDLSSTIAFKGLKRLLNVVMNENNQSNTDKSGIKITALCKATKESKSVSSFLAGDTTDLESEIILQCVQRSLGYAIVKVGKIIGDEDEIPQGVKIRNSVESNSIPVNEKQISLARKIPPKSIEYTSSKIIEYNERTRLSSAAQALLRSAVDSHRNSTISVLSNNNKVLPTDEDWSDEFLKLYGPELYRIPIRFASYFQSLRAVTRIASSFLTPGNGLITPIKIENFNNGVRISFLPFVSNYVSSKEEKQLSAKEEEEKLSAQLLITKSTKSKYISPEMELRNEKIASQAMSNKIETKVKISPIKLEGGLEIIVENEPYLRVRIKRCNMGPQTIVKEESEKLILKKIVDGIKVLDNDYKILMTSDLDKIISSSKLI